MNQSACQQQMKELAGFRKLENPKNTLPSYMFADFQVVDCHSRKLIIVCKNVRVDY